MARFTRRSTVIAASALVGAAVLTGCGSPSEPETMLSQWLRTERGDVYCAVDEKSSYSILTDCDWSTLVETGTHTANGDEPFEGEWRESEKGKIYCLVQSTRSGEITDCDWTSLGQDSPVKDEGLDFNEEDAK